MGIFEFLKVFFLNQKNLKRYYNAYIELELLSNKFTYLTCINKSSTRPRILFYAFWKLFIIVHHELSIINQIVLYAFNCFVINSFLTSNSRGSRFCVI